MSPREKKLLIFFAAAGFLVINFLAYSWYGRLKIDYRAKLDEATVALERAEMLRASSELVVEQMEWLAEHEPEPMAYQDAQAALQEFVQQQARAAGLTIKPNTQRLLDVDDTGTHYHRARIQLEVTGQEQALYKWLYQIKSPEQFRATTRILVNPNREDEALIDCRADIEQWFIPAEPGA